MNIKEMQRIQLVKMVFELLIFLSGFIICSRHHHGNKNLNILAELRRGFIMMQNNQSTFLSLDSGP